MNEKELKYLVGKYIVGKQDGDLFKIRSFHLEAQAYPCWKILVESYGCDRMLFLLDVADIGVEYSEPVDTQDEGLALGGKLYAEYCTAIGFNDYLDPSADQLDIDMPF